MIAFDVTVRTEHDGIFIYGAIGPDSASVAMDAIDIFGIAAITVKPA